MKKINWWIVLRNISTVIMIFTIIFTYVSRAQEEKLNILEYLHIIDTSIVSYTEVSEDPLCYEVVDEFGVITYVAATSSSGYGGPITILTQVDTDGTIEDVVIASDYETAVYLKIVTSSGLLDWFEGMHVTDSFEYSPKDMGVSGATVSSDAIVSAVEKAAVLIANTHFGEDLNVAVKSVFTIDTILILLMFILSALAIALRIRKARPFIMVLSFFIIGYYLNASISLSSFISILMGQLPVFSDRPAWYIMVFGIIIITLIWGKNIYCGWLCPFGAAQVAVNKIGRKGNLKVNTGISLVAKRSRHVMLYFAVFIALLFNNPAITDYQPFSPLFAGEGSDFQWLIMVFALGAGVFWYRFWCKYFCPVGMVLDFLALIKIRLFRYKKRITKNDSCSGCTKCKSKTCLDKVHIEEMEFSDLIFSLLVIAFNILILMALVENVLF